MKNKLNIKIIAIAVVAVLTISLVSCSSSKGDYTMASEPDYPATAANMGSENMKSVAKDDYYSETEMVTEEPALPEQASPATGGGGGEATSISAQFPQSNTRKLVVNSNINLETKNFDDGITLIQQKTTEYGGYIEASYFYGGDIYNPAPARSVSYTLRIPAEKAAEFIMSLEKGEFNILSSSQNVEDITEKYFDIQAELDSYLEQKESLETLREKEGDLEYLILVEQEIARVNTEINRLHNILKNMDSLVSYSSITVVVNEVLEYIEQPLPTVTFGQKIINTLRNTWKGTIDGSQNFVLFLIGAIPVVIIIGILVFIGLKIKKRVDKNSGARKAARAEKAAANPPIVIDYTTNNSSAPPTDNTPKADK